MSEIAPPSERTRLRRGANRAVYEADRIKEILAAGVVAHVGVTTDDGPIVLPMAYGVRDEEILVHGAVANAMLRAGGSTDVCITVTIVDGLVVARSPFHNSMNYRSVVIRGAAGVIDGDAHKLAAVEVINDHITPTWADARPPSAIDVRKTLVLSVPLAEASAKVRDGDPVDEPEDYDGPWWAGVIPLSSTWGQPIPALDLQGEPETPMGIATLAGRDAHRPRD